MFRPQTFAVFLVEPCIFNGEEGGGIFLEVVAGGAEAQYRWHVFVFLVEFVVLMTAFFYV
jgi:hypothetical protein